MSQTEASYRVTAERGDWTEREERLHDSVSDLQDEYIRIEAEPEIVALRRALHLFFKILGPRFRFGVEVAGD